jgi:twinkle protein
MPTHSSSSRTRSADWLKFVRHVACPACGSRDANALYADGHHYCWSCEHYTPSPDEDGEPEDKHYLGKLVASRPKALPSRGLHLDTVQKFGYGVGYAKHPETHKMAGCQVAPYYDAKGRLVGQKLRFKDKVFCTTGNVKSAVLFGRHLWRPGPKRTVVITEGELDALSVSQAQGNKWAVVSLVQGAKSIKKLPLEIDWLDQFGRIVLMFDQDEAGREAAEEAALLLPPGKVHIATLDRKDPNEVLTELGGRSLVDAMWDARLWQPEGLVWGDAAWELYTKQGVARSIPYSHPVLDETMEGHRDGEIITVCAGTGAGKSSWVREECVAMLKHLPAGERVGIIALEEPVRRQITGLCSIAMEKPLHLRTCADVPEEEIKEVFEREFGDRVVFDNHNGSVASERLINTMRYMARGLDVRRIVLDHLTIVVAGQDTGDNDRKAIDVLLTNLVSLTEETGVSVFLVSHLKRPHQGRGFEEGRPVTLGDLRGSSMIEALSNDVIALERNQQAEEEEERNIATLRTLKCRMTGNTGIAGKLRWHQDRCRMLPALDDDEHDFDTDTEHTGDFE